MAVGADIPTLDKLRARRGEIVAIVKHQGACNLRVFGSIAQGDAGTNSDIDLLVEMEPGRTVFDLSELILDLQETLDRHVDVIEIKRSTPLAARILSESVAL